MNIIVYKGVVQRQLKASVYIVLLSEALIMSDQSISSRTQRRSRDEADDESTAFHLLKGQRKDTL